jgi:hypothetical protein
MVFTGDDTVVATDALLPVCDLHSFDVDGAVTISMRIGDNALKVVGTVADGFLNIHLGGVAAISVLETGSTDATVNIHSSRV